MAPKDTVVDILRLLLFVTQTLKRTSSGLSGMILQAVSQAQMYLCAHAHRGCYMWRSGLGQCS